MPYVYLCDMSLFLSLYLSSEMIVFMWSEQRERNKWARKLQHDKKFYIRLNQGQKHK